MSDVSANKRPQINAPRMLFKDAVRFFNSFPGPERCYVCGRDNWNINTMEGDDEYCFFRTAVGISNDLPVYNLDLECNSCGLVRAHRSDVLLAWVEANPASGAKGQAGSDE